MNKQFFIYLFGFFCISLNSYAIHLPILPLPKVVLQYEEGNNQNGNVKYGNITFEWQNTSAEPFRLVQEELLQLSQKDSPNRLKVIVELNISKKAQKAFCRKYSLNEKYLDSIKAEGYLLHKSDSCIHIMSNSSKGLLYGIQSAKQLVRSGYPSSLSLADWPDFSQRIFFDDISRGPISNMAYIKKQIRDLSELKYNAFTFYIEHVVQPLSYPDFAPENGKLTIDDIKEICRYAKAYQIEVIGSFQCFGHFEKILSLPKYAALGDTPSMISPLNQNSKQFLKSVLGELADVFSSKYFNINCDETWDLENGKSKDYVKKIGADRFYADHILFLYNVLKAKNKKVMMWGDMIMKYPHLLSKLPQDITYLTWNYSGNNYDEWIKPFKDNHSKFLVCPGILNSNRLFPDLNMTRENMQFITDGYRAGAQGVLYTSWDDSSFHTFASLMYGVALASEFSWNASRKPDMNSFDERYCHVRLATANSAFMQTLNKLMSFAKLGITYEMNDRVFYERFIPEKDKVLYINNKELEMMRDVLDSVK